MRKSDRLQKDKDRIRNLKAVLSMRDKLKMNQPGKQINGRELLKPVPLNMSTFVSKRNSISYNSSRSRSPSVSPSKHTAQDQHLFGSGSINNQLMEIHN